MAHSEETRLAARKAFVYEQANLAGAAKASGVTIETVRRWKKQAKENGDCWQRARSAYLLAKGGIEGATHMVLEKFTIQFYATMGSLEEAVDLDPSKRAEALSRLADAYTKTTKAASMGNPELARLSIAMDTLQHFSTFLEMSHPDLLEQFVPVLEPFGKYLTKAMK